jgi:hypothetical protein
MYQLGGCPEKIARGAVFDLLRYSLTSLMQGKGFQWFTLRLLWGIPQVRYLLTLRLWCSH